MSAKKFAKTKNALLVTGLKECWPDFNITSTELVHPTLDTNIKFFERFLCDSGIKCDSILKVFSQEYEECNNYENIMYLYVVYACASRKYSLLNLSPNYAITLPKFLNPSDDKNFVTRLYLLSNNINYYKMKDVDLIQPLKNAMLEDVQTLDHLKSKSDVLTENLNSATLTQLRNEEKLRQIQTNIETLSNKLYESQVESDELNKEFEALTAEVKMFEEENDEVSSNLENNLAKKEILTAQVVDNPESITAERTKIENQIQEDQELSNECERNLELKIATESDLLKNYEAVLNITENFSLATKLNTIDLIDENNTEIEKILKETKNARKVAHEEHTIALSKKQEIEQLEEKFQNLEIQYACRIQDLDNEIAHLRNDQDELTNHLGKDKSVAAGLYESHKYIVDCSDKYKDKIEEQNARYRNVMSRIQAEQHNLNNRYVRMLTIKDILDSEKTKK